MLGQLRLRVAYDTSRFVMILQSRKQMDGVRDALSEEQRALFDGIVEACESLDLDVPEDIDRVAGLSLMFGGAMQSDPSSGVKLYGVLDNMGKLALIELSNLLKIFHEAIESS